MATLVGTVPLRGAAMLTQKTVYQISRSALSRARGRDVYRTSAKAATIAERKLLGQTASNATTSGGKAGLAKEAGNTGIVSPLKELDIKEGSKITTNNALELDEKYFGTKYNDLGKGRLVSQDRLKQVRMGDADILGQHGLRCYCDISSAF